MNFKVVNRGNGFHSIVEDLKDYTRKAIPYHVNFMYRDDKVMVIRGNIMLTLPEIKAIFQRGF